MNIKYTGDGYCGFQFAPMNQWYEYLKDNDCAGYRTDVPIYIYEDVPRPGHYEKKFIKEGYWE